MVMNLKPTPFLVLLVVLVAVGINVSGYLLATETFSENHILIEDLGFLQLAYAGVPTHGGLLNKICDIAELNVTINGAEINCDWTFTSEDALDGLDILDACDFQNDTAVVPEFQCESSEGLPFIATGTNITTTCDTASSLPCTLGFDDSITFFVTAVAPGAGDYKDESFVDFDDLCESGDPGCPVGIDFGFDSVITTVPKATPAIVGQSSILEPILKPINFTVTDTANIYHAFFPTGDITFDLFRNSPNCEVIDRVFTDTVTVTNGNTTSAEFNVTLPGDYDWIAFYSGDGNNTSASTVCNDPNQSFTAIVAIGGPTIKITKDTTNGDGSFDFTIFNATNPANSTALNIPDTSINNMTAPLTVQAGSFSVVETVPLNWNLISSDCLINGIPQGTTLNFNIINGDTVECIFVNLFVAPPRTAVGGELIPLDTTMVLVAGTQTAASWMIPVIVSAIGIGIVIARKF